MKITAVDARLVNLGSRNVPFVLVHTDEGITGVGEAYSCGPDRATVEVMAPNADPSVALKGTKFAEST